MKTTPSMSRRFRSCRAMSLVEVLCSTALMVVTIGGALVTFVAVQRTLVAAKYQMDAQADQNRVLSYMRRDLRGASAVQIGAQGTQITVTLPSQAAPTLNVNLGLALLSLLAPPQSAPAATTIRYYRQGTSIIREVNGVATELSSTATNFQASFNNANVQVGTEFQPRFCFGKNLVTQAATQTTALVHLLNTTSL